VNIDETSAKAGLLQVFSLREEEPAHHHLSLKSSAWADCVDEAVRAASHEGRDKTPGAHAVHVVVRPAKVADYNRRSFVVGHVRQSGCCTSQVKV